MLTIGMQAPSSAYRIKIEGVYRVGGEVWVVSRIHGGDDIGLAVISDIGASADVRAGDLPKGKFDVRHKVMGKDWNWGDERKDVEFITADGEKALKKKLSTAKKIPFVSIGAGR